MLPDRHEDSTLVLPRREIRDSSMREPRAVPAHKTALFRGALLEIQRQETEIQRLRDRLRQAGVDEEGSR